MRDHLAVYGLIPLWLAGSTVATGLELELYAQAHLSADSVDDGADRSEYFASNSSRLGLRGSQRLSDELSVIVQYEQGVDLTGQGENDGNGPGSTSGLFTAARDSFIGLTGNFGTFKVGKLSGLNQWVYDFNLFADQVGDLGNLWGGTGLPGRVTSAAQYVSPAIGGIEIGLTYVPEEGEDEADLIVLKADYANDGFQLGFAFIDLSNRWRGGAITGSYRWDRASLGAGWQRETSIGDIRGNDRNSYTLGASYELMTGLTAKAQFVQSNSRLQDADATQWAVGLDYQLHPALSVYAAFATTRNDMNAAFSANNWGKGDAVFPLPGQNPSAVSVGAVYRFSISR